jgi:plastocyanin
MKLKMTTAVLAVLAVASVPAVAHAYGDHHDGGHGGGHGSGSKRHENARTVPGAREIEVSAKSFEFSPDEITVGAGEDVTISLRSTDVLHDFVAKRAGHIVSAKAKKTKRGGLRIDEPGTYRFWCSIPGHRSAGMVGTIVVA